MCGIIGVLGRREVAPVILDALKRLSYRGYDSAGIATAHEGVLDRRRAVGKIANLQNLVLREPIPGFAGIGHTRWATHGTPSVENAHPHQTGRVAVVHNGIIENFQELRQELSANGVAFASQTDTETIVHLASQYLESGASPLEAAQATISRLEGAFALVFLFKGEEGLLIAARSGSPLVIGHGDGEMYVGSDAIALAPLTDKLTYLMEGDCAAITRNAVRIFDARGGQVDRPIATTAAENIAVDHAGHQTFMAKEMAEQPRIIEKVLSAYTHVADETLNLPDGLQFRDIGRVVMVACGTAFYACQVAKYWFEQIARIPVEIDIASEFRYRDPVLKNDDLIIVVSQSGETADTLAALRHARDHVRQVLAVVNVPTSSIAREADVVMPILAGPEIGVASTKAFTAQLLCLLLLGAKAGVERDTLDAQSFKAILSEIEALPALISQALGQEQEYARVAQRLAQSDDVIFLGRGAMFPLALEAALKLKEISYIHAEAFAAGELKHGPIALVDETLPIILFAPRDALFEKTRSNMQEVMARKGQVFLFTDTMGANQAGDAQNVIAMPETQAVVAPLIYAIPAQMLAYHTALVRGTDVDQPRNLAKSVTVE